MYICIRGLVGKNDYHLLSMKGSHKSYFSTCTEKIVTALRPTVGIYMAVITYLQTTKIKHSIDLETFEKPDSNLRDFRNVYQRGSS